MQSIVIAVLLATGVATLVLSAIGLVRCTSTLDRVHYLAPATTIGTACVLVAVVAAEGLTAMTEGAVLTAIILMLSGPIISHAIGRAAYDIEHHGKR